MIGPSRFDRARMAFGSVSGLALAPALGWLVACSAVPENPTARAELAPVELPSYTVGTVYKEHDLIAGKDGGWRVEAVDGDLVHAAGLRGCRFSFKDPLLPALSWEDCDGASGRRVYTSVEGSLWPLQVGRTATYRMSWTDSRGYDDSGTLTCSVDQTAFITTRAGELDTYRIVCRQDWADVHRTRVTWWSPELGQIKFTDTHNKNGLTRSTELLQVVEAGS